MLVNLAAVFLVSFSLKPGKLTDADKSARSESSDVNNMTFVKFASDILAKLLTKCLMHVSFLKFKS